VGAGVPCFGFRVSDFGFVRVCGLGEIYPFQLSTSSQW
jgi:hypothetical protein